MHGNPPKLPGHWLVYAFMAIFGLSLFYVGFKIGNAMFPPYFLILLSLTTLTLNLVCFFVFRTFFGRNTLSKGVINHILLTACIILTTFYAILYMFGSGAPLAIAVPATSVGALLISVLYGLVIIHEKLDSRKIAGIILAIISIIMVNW